MKLFNWLLFILIPFQLLIHFGFGQAKFPARGFSPILNDLQAEEKLDSFRRSFFPVLEQSHPSQAYLYQFQFKHFPKKGQPLIHHGLLSGPSPNSPILRIDLLNDRGGTNQASYLLQRDRHKPKVYKYTSGKNEVKELAPAEWMLPWAKEINHSPFDLLMPFINWSFEYEKSGRLSGRPSHLFLFMPPQKKSIFPPSLLAIRIAIDDSYCAPLRIEHLDGGILPARIFSLQSFKKFNDRWLVKAIDAKDRDTGSRTRYELQAAAHGLDLPQSVFQSRGLNLPIPQSFISFTSL